MFQVCRMFVKLALLVLGGGSMCSPNVGAGFRSQHLSHISPIWVQFLLSGEGDGCAQLDQMDLKKNECTCCLLHEKGEISSKLPHVAPPTLTMDFI